MSRSSLSMLLLVLFTGCVQDDPASPVQRQLATQEGADVQHLTFSFPVDNTVYAACLGENLHFTGTATARGYIVNTPSGLSLQHMTGLEWNSNPVVGMTSGTEWVLIHQFVLRNVLHSGVGPDDVLAMETEWMENAAGQRMHARNHVTLLYNARGEPTAFRFEVVECNVTRPK